MKGFTLVVAAAFLCAELRLWDGLNMTIARAGERHTLTCGPEKTIGQAIKRLKPGDTLLVSGTCNENVDIGEEVHRITLDGQGTASHQRRFECERRLRDRHWHHDTRIRHHRRRATGRRRHGRRVRGD